MTEANWGERKQHYIHFEAGGKTEGMDVAPYIRNGRTYLPVRYLAYACGVVPEDIAWDGITRTVILKKGPTTLRLTVGSQDLTVEQSSAAGEVLKTIRSMDVAPEIKNDRVMLFARYVAEGFGFQVQWVPDTKAVVIL
ncbi:MAG TPA: copper amine oxidase N-terminal domain-containing protein [Desulfotomaculum sp.]|nr:copper amine oxidase N-terminal domain-containing protein [Desulfotomaculum sp.]